MSVSKTKFEPVDQSMDPKSRMPKKPGAPSPLRRPVHGAPAKPAAPLKRPVAGVPARPSAPAPSTHRPSSPPLHRPTSTRTSAQPAHPTHAAPRADAPKRISSRAPSVAPASHAPVRPSVMVAHKPVSSRSPAVPAPTHRGPNPISARISHTPVPEPESAELRPDLDDEELEAALEADIEVTPMPTASLLNVAETKEKATAETVEAPRPVPASAPAPDAKAQAAELDDDDDLDAPRARGMGRDKKIVIGLVALIAVLVCAIAALLIKKHKSGSGETAQLQPDGSDSGSGSGSAPGMRVSGPLIPEFQKKHARSTRNLLLASDGAVATGGQRPEVIIDGISDAYDAGAGYATTNNNDPKEQFLITLKEPRDMTRIRMLLWDKDPRTFRYIISVSPDGKNFKKVQDNSKRESQSWQEVRFARQKVKVVAIKGVASSVNEFFHPVEVEGYDDGAEADKFTRRTAPKGPMKSSASSLKPGVWAEFFDTVDTFPAVEDTPELTRPQSSLAFGASTPAPPGQGIHDWPFNNACAAAFSGYVKIEKQGLYTFFLESENGSRLYLDGELLINNEGDHKLLELWEQIDLNPGLHRIYVEYYTFGGATGLNVSIKPKGESKDYLSGKWLCYDPLDVTGVDPETRRSPDAPRESAKPYVKFLGRNDKRAGSWKREVGHDGYVMFNKIAGGQHLQKLPPYIASLTTAADHCVWNQSEDPRNLEDPEGKAPRIAACEYSGNEALIDIRAAKNIVNHLSIYFLDFDKLSRKDHVQFYSGDDLLYETDVADFGNGAWMEFEVAGSVLIKLQNACTTNAVVSGVFWDSERGIHYKVPPKGPPSVATMKPGVVAEYYDNMPLYPTDDDQPTIVRLEPTLAFGATVPPTAERILHGWPMAGAVSAVFHGVINVPADEKYAFSLTSDDGSRFYIDGDKVIDNDGAHGMKEVEGAVELKAGMHRIWLEWFNGGGPFGLNLLIKQKDGKKVPIPAEWLGHE